MRVIDQFAFPKNSNAKFPFGSTILNETDINDGTPVVEEVYGDIIMNIYRILVLTGIIPTGDQDSNVTQFQVVEAIQKLPNVINDTEHSMILTGTVWSVQLKLQYLPNKFVFFARASEIFDPGTNYTFAGNDAEVIEYPIICPNGFSAGDEIMVVIDQSTVRVYPLASSSVVTSDRFLPIALGTPLPFNNSKFFYCFDNGKLYYDLPTVYNIETTLRTFTSDSTVTILQVFALKGKLVCFTTDSTNKYRFYQFDLSNLSSPALVTYDIPNSTDRLPYCYTDGTYIYITNDANTSANDYVLKKLNYNELTMVMTTNSTINLHNTFYKTTNAVLKPNALITLISGTLTSFSLINGSKTSLGVYDNAIGNLFYYKTGYYFGISEIAAKWLL